MRQLLHSWDVGSRDRTVHEGFGVCRVAGGTLRPVGRPDMYRTADEAIAAAELDPDLRAFRIVRTRDQLEPREPLSRDDLPVAIVPRLAR